MSDDVKRDIYGVPTDPADRYHEFLLGLYDIAAEASDAEYSSEALAVLRQARLMFMAEFENKFPGAAKVVTSRALWK